MRPASQYNYGGGKVKSKRLEPTIVGGKRNIEASFFGSNSNEGQERHQHTPNQELTPEEITNLQRCLTVTRPKIYEYTEFMTAYLYKYLKGYQEDLEPLPVLFFDRDPQTGLFRPNKNRTLLSKASFKESRVTDYSRFSKKDRLEFQKNQDLQYDMEKLIKMLQKRDTRGNIIKLQEELDDLAAQSNPLKKCLSMYKIKEKMDKIETSTAQEQQQKRREQQQSQEGGDRKGAKKCSITTSNAAKGNKNLEV